jgi:hypothetical protein
MSLDTKLVEDLRKKGYDVTYSNGKLRVVSHNGANDPNMLLLADMIKAEAKQQGKEVIEEGKE